MWSQTWSNILDILVPYKNIETVDVTNELQKQVCKMLHYNIFVIVHRIIFKLHTRGRRNRGGGQGGNILSTKKLKSLKITTYKSV